MKIIILGQEYVKAPALPPGACTGCAGRTDGGGLCFKLPMCTDLSTIFVKAPETTCKE